MAKSGKISSVGGASQAILDAGAAPESRTGTLGSVVQSVLDAAQDDVIVAVNYATRKVFVFPTASRATLIAAIGAGTIAAHLVPVGNPDSRSIPFVLQGGNYTVGNENMPEENGLQTELVNRLQPVAPRFTESSLIAMVEDAIEPSGIGPAIAVLDQDLGTFKVYGSNADVSVVAGKLAEFTQTLAAAGGGEEINWFQR